MKPTCSVQKSRGLTLVEILVIIFALTVLSLLLLPALAAAKKKATKIQCANNLSQIELAFRVWEGNHNNNYPRDLSSTNIWTFGRPAQVNVESVFRIMSNELSTPFVLVCPADKNCQEAPDFKIPLTSSNISYFINLDANEVNPQDPLSGDDNFEVNGVPVKSSFLEISSSTLIAWSAARHRFSGNIALADGSVQGVSNFGLINYFCSTNAVHMRLAIP